MYLCRNLANSMPSNNCMIWLFKKETGLLNLVIYYIMTVWSYRFYSWHWGRLRFGAASGRTAFGCDTLLSAAECYPAGLCSWCPEAFSCWAAVNRKWNESFQIFKVLMNCRNRLLIISWLLLNYFSCLALATIRLSTRLTNMNGIQ